MKERVGVVGAGLMGSEIALVHALAAHVVRFPDRSADQVKAALGWLHTQACTASQTPPLDQQREAVLRRPVESGLYTVNHDHLSGRPTWWFLRFAAV
jgi:3-hydroxyacyl-CoA dehydrogenase